MSGTTEGKQWIMTFSLVRKACLLFVFMVLFSGWAFATHNGFQHDGWSWWVIAPSTITTYTTEPCGFEWGSGGGELIYTWNIPADMAKRYPCTVGSEDGFVEFISELYRFMYFLALIFGVAMIILAGVALSMSGAAWDKSKEFAKKWIPKILFGVIWLLFIPFILKTMAPFFFK